MKPTDYNDFADKWIELNTEVRMMHNYTLQADWENASKSAKVCHQLSSELVTIFNGYNTK